MISTDGKESSALMPSVPDEELDDGKFWCDMRNQEGKRTGRVLLSIEVLTMHLLYYVDSTPPGLSATSTAT